MFRMAVGHSDDIDLESALEAVFRECDAGLRGATPKAALLFAAWDLDQSAVLAAIHARYPGIDVGGATTAGEMSSMLGFSEDSVAMAMFASDVVDMSSGLGTNLLADPREATRRAVEQATSKTSKPVQLCLVMPTVAGNEADDIVAGLRDALGSGVPIVGGGASPEDPAQPGATVGNQIAGDIVAEDAISILLFSGALDFSFGVRTGWKGVGPRGTVTRTTADGAVAEIDGRPAIELYSRYLGTGQPPVANPLAVFEPGDADRFYLRTPISYDRDSGTVGFYGPVPEGATVQLTVAAPEQLFEGATASISEALSAFPGGGTPDAALVYSCATRRFLLGTRVGREIELVQEVLGADVPVAGMYCLGEIAPMTDADRSRFHNATLVSVLLGAH
jgi:hypothetical protein